MTLELTDWLRRNLAARAAAEAPEEACGLIGRARNGCLGLWVAENSAEDPQASFEIRADHLLELLRAIDMHGETLAGVYHSHPHGIAEPSVADRQTARLWPGLTWVIVGIGSGEPEFWSGVLVP